jgi:hypothetical protein
MRRSIARSNWAATSSTDIARAFGAPRVVTLGPNSSRARAWAHSWSVCSCAGSVPKKAAGPSTAAPAASGGPVRESGPAMIWMAYATHCDEHGRIALVLARGDRLPERAERANVVAEHRPDLRADGEHVSTDDGAGPRRMIAIASSRTGRPASGRPARHRPSS